MMLVAYDGVLAALGDMAGLRGQCLTRLRMPYCFTVIMTYYVITLVTKVICTSLLRTRHSLVNSLVRPGCACQHANVIGALLQVPIRGGALDPPSAYISNCHKWSSRVRHKWSSRVRRVRHGGHACYACHAVTSQT